MKYMAASVMNICPFKKKKTSWASFNNNLKHNLGTILRNKIF